MENFSDIIYPKYYSNQEENRIVKFKSPIEMVILKLNSNPGEYLCSFQSKFVKPSQLKITEKTMIEISKTQFTAFLEKMQLIKKEVLTSQLGDIV